MENKIQKNSCVNILTKMKYKKILVNILTSAKKAQITLFMILGVIILFAFGFLYFSMSASQQARVKAQVVEKVGDIFNQQSIQYFEFQCLKDVLKDGLMLIGEQGGYITLPPGMTQNANSVTYLQ